MQVVALFLNFKTFLNVLILIRVLLFWYAGDAHFYLFLLALYKSFIEKKEKKKRKVLSLWVRQNFEIFYNEDPLQRLTIYEHFFFLIHTWCRMSRYQTWKLERSKAYVLYRFIKTSQKRAKKKKKKRNNEISINPTRNQKKSLLTSYTLKFESAELFRI